MEKNYSVLMSVYAKDKPEYLELAIDSMLRQTIPPEQFVIVVDGAVPDKIGKIIVEHEKDKALFTVLWLKENKGLANALNKGLNVCRNEYVARMDADDISLPSRCEKELEYFAKIKDLVICGCNIDEFYEDINNIKASRTVPAEYKSIMKFMRKRQPFNHPTVMYKKSCVLACGGYPLLRRKEDFDLFSRMLKKGYYALNIDESLYLYRVNENNYKRRKSWTNTKSAVYVYTLHLKRKGCTIIDFFIICGAEILFFIMPVRVVKIISDNLLRERYQ